MIDKHIGLIGTGIMGEPMARNLLKNGFELSVFTRTKSKASALIQEGATWCDTPSDLSANADVVISIVSDTPDVKEVYLGESGVCMTLRPKTLCIDMSTVAPEAARQIDQVVTAHGAHFLDAPVSGGGTGAIHGTLAIMVGGRAVDVERAKPIFDALGKSVVHCGPVGNGQLTKLCNQILCGLNLLGVAEAVGFAKKVGLDPAVMMQAVSGGAAGSWALDNLGTRMIHRDFDPMFMIDLQQKDLRIALHTAARQLVSLPGTGLVTQLLAANQAAGEGAEGTQALLKTIERLSGSYEAT